MARKAAKRPAKKAVKRKTTAKTVAARAKALKRPAKKRALKKPITQQRIVGGFIVDEVEKRYGARYVGYYDIPPGRGPLLVFWQENPRTDLGHDNYFALYRELLSGTPYITSAKSIRDAVYPAIEVEPGKFMVSRFRHDYQTHPSGAMLDGGLDYTRYNPQFPVTHQMRIVDGREVFEPIPPKANTSEPESEFVKHLAEVSADNSMERLSKRYEERGINGISGLLFDVGSFHIAADQPVRYEPEFPSQEEIDFRIELIDEEFNEFKEACAERNIVKAADALGDIIYVVVGGAHHLGIALDYVWDEIQRSNMAKVDPAIGKVRKRADGKVLKPEGWKPPNVEAAFVRAALAKAEALS